MGENLSNMSITVVRRNVAISFTIPRIQEIQMRQAYNQAQAEQRSEACKITLGPTI